MEIINLNVDVRSDSDNLKSMRKNGFIPAVIYGRALAPLKISLNYKDFVKTFTANSVSSFMNVVSKEDKINGKTAVIKEIQKDPVTDRVIHVDFHEVSMDEKIEIEAAIHLLGKPEGVKLGGILELLVRHITIKGYPKDIIDTINIDVASLQIGNIIHVRDLKLGEGIEILADEDTPIVTVAEPTVEEPASASQTTEAATPVATAQQPQQKA